MRRALAEEAISLARATEDSEDACRSPPERRRGDPSTGYARLANRSCRGARWLRRRGGSILRSDLSAHNFRLPHLRRAGGPRTRKARARAAQLLAHELDQPTLKWFAAFTARPVGSSCTAIWSPASAYSRARCRSGRRPDNPTPSLPTPPRSQQARIYQGRAQEIIEMMEQSVSAYPAIAAWRAGLASILCYLDRGAEAAKILEQAASDRFEHIAPNSATLTALALYADAAVLTDSSGPASILYELIEPWADQVVWNGVIGYGHARMWLGLLAACMGDHEQADRALGVRVRFPGDQRLASVGSPRPFGLGGGARRARRRCCSSTRARRPRARAVAASTATASLRSAQPPSSRRSQPPRMHCLRSHPTHAARTARFSAQP